MELVKENGNWGYEIRKNKQLVIRQIQVPALMGEYRFKTKKDAEKVGARVVFKLNNKETPGISLQELKELEVSYH